jgi:DNA-binding HxlR family transcriptional regulator
VRTPFPARTASRPLSLPVASEKMLAQALRTLTDDGFVVRDQKNVVPPHVEYALTGTGREIVALLQQPVRLVAEHAREDLGAP